MTPAPISWFVALVAAFAALAQTSEASAQDRDLEWAVKATFLYRFGSFVGWPPGTFASEDAPLQVCVSGDAAFAQLVQQAATGERVGAHPVAVRRLSTVSRTSGCHVVYLAGVYDQSVEQGLRALRGAPVLTVTDSRHGGVRGAVHFVIDDGRVRFHIDRTAAEAQGLNLSSRLLSIALSVRGQGSATP